MKISYSGSSIMNDLANRKNINIEAILVEYDQYLIRQVQDCMRSHSNVVRPRYLIWRRMNWSNACASNLARIRRQADRLSKNVH